LPLAAQDAGVTRADWPHYGGTQFSWRYSALDQVNTSNVKNLLPAWIFQTGDYSEYLGSTPIVADGVMYLISASARVFALDAAKGTVIWQYRYPAPRPGIAGSHFDFIQNRGVALSDGKVIFGTRDNFLVALNQKTGREMWKVSVDDPKQCGCNNLAAPLIVKDKVIVGGNGGDQAHRGDLTAFNIKTGRLAWRWYVVPGPGEKGNETWKGDSWRFGGGSPWLTESYDSDLNLVYWGTGNAAADFYDADRVKAGVSKTRDVNLYTASVVALDADTGKLRWHFQEVPDDVWDFDSSYEVLLMDKQIRGQMRKVRVHMNKSGLTFVLDRATGEFLNSFNVPELSDVAALKALTTPQVSTATIDSQSMPALVVSKKANAVVFYDLTSAPPVLRSESPASVQTREGSTWRHSSVIGAYNDPELTAMLSYLRAVVKP
jgi:PQQ-dependent dehydrogenase (methanol/ethanol family)